MKTVIALFALLTAVISVQAQEYDDMYFKSKDRTKAVANDKVATVRASQNTDDADQVQARINPTDSYSGRNVNPEYASRNTVTSTGTDEDAQYFVSGYQPTGVNQSLPSYNANTFYGPYSGNNAFASSYYGYGSGFGYNPAFANPYSSFAPSYYWNSFYPGMSLGYSWGMGAGYYGMNMGYGSYFGSGYGFGAGSYYGGWGSPYSAFAYSGYPYYGGYYGYGSYYGYGYPSQMVIINNNNSDGRSGYVYGKRGSRSSDINNQSYNASTVDRGRSRGTIANSTGATGGRSASTSQYYQNGWRSNPDVQRNITNGSNSGRSAWGSSSGLWGNSNGTRQSSGWDSNSGGRSTWGGNNNSGGFNSGSSSFGRSSGGSFGGSGGGASHSSGGGGGSRGRH